MADRDEAVLAKRMLEANKALAEAIRDDKKLAAMVKAERAAEEEHQRLAEQALLEGNEEAARAALEAKRRRGKERARHEELVKRQRRSVARHRVAAASLREQLAELRDRAPKQELDAAQAFRRAAWLRLLGSLPERALAKAAAPLVDDEHDLRDQLRDMLRLAAELDKGREAQRARTARRRELAEEAQSEAERWKKRAGLAVRAGDDASAKALLLRHRTWLSRAAELAASSLEAEQRLEEFEQAVRSLAEALAEARKAVPLLMAGLSQ